MTDDATTDATTDETGVNSLPLMMRVINDTLVRITQLCAGAYGETLACLTSESLNLNNL